MKKRDEFILLVMAIISMFYLGYLAGRRSWQEKVMESGGGRIRIETNMPSIK